jgi:hypothetical protein
MTRVSQPSVAQLCLGRVSPAFLGPVQPHDPVGRYLYARVGLTAFAPCLRYPSEFTGRALQASQVFSPRLCDGCYAIVANAAIGAELHKATPLQICEQPRGLSL